jgi:nucleoside-diphosphate-sugar epimerase
VGPLPDLAPGAAEARFVTEPASGLPSACTAHLAGHRVLVTGATGFVGRHVVRALAAGPGGAIRILARSHDRAREVFGPLADSLEVRLGDLTDAASLEGVCDGVAFVIHGGSAVPYAFTGAAPAGAFARVNRGGTENLAREALRARVRRLVHVSSTAAMGTPLELSVDERTPCRPTSAYQISKYEAEQSLLRLHRDQGLDLAIVRPCLVAGEGKRGGELLKLFRLCRRGVFPVIGRRLDVEKPLIAVDDLVQALLLAAGRGAAGEIYLVHSDGGHTLGAILREAGRLVGKPRPYLSIPLTAARLGARTGTWLAGLLGRPSPLTPQRLDLFLADRRIDIRKAREELGYQPRHQDLGEMLGRTHAYYVATGQLQ